MQENVQHVFLVGAKSLGAYGGYETFINKLTEYHQDNPNIKYHVAVKANGQGAAVPETAVRTSETTYAKGTGHISFTTACSTGNKKIPVF